MNIDVDECLITKYFPTAIYRPCLRMRGLESESLFGDCKTQSLRGRSYWPSVASVLVWKGLYRHRPDTRASWVAAGCTWFITVSSICILRNHFTSLCYNWYSDVTCSFFCNLNVVTDTGWYVSSRIVFLCLRSIDITFVDKFQRHRHREAVRQT